MLLSVCSPVISAVGSLEHLHKDVAGDSKLHYVSLGASNTNGYGHHGYLDDEIYEDPLAAPKAQMNDYGYDKSPANAYPSLIRDELAAITGREVELHQLAISSMRVEEVLWLLDDEFQPDEYMDWRFTGGKSWFDMAHKEGGREALRVEYRNYIANADVISVDLGWNNFGVYAFNNIMTILKEGGSRYWKAPDFESVIDAGMEEEYYAIRSKVVERLNEFVDLSDTALSENTIEMLADVLTYAAFGACYNFDRVIENIRKLNPDATIVTINIQNLADELMVDLNGTQLPLGDMYGELIEFVDLYRATMSPYKNEYLFAYAGEDGDVDTFLDEFRLWDGNPATLTQDMKDLFDMYDDNLYVRSKIEYMMIGQVLSALFKNIRDMGAYYGLSVFTDDDQYTYDFALDMAWLNNVDLAALDFNNPDTPLEEYGAALSKHLVNLRNYTTTGKDAYNYVFENLTSALTLQKTEVEIQKTLAIAQKTGLEATRDSLINDKSNYQTNLEEKREELETLLEENSNSDQIIKLQTEIAALEAAIPQFEEGISQCNEGIAQYEAGIAQAEAGIAQLEEAITTIIPVAKQGFDNALAGVYQVYVNTLNYAYDTVGTIIQYTLQFNTFYMSSDSMSNHNNKTNELTNYVVNTFTNNTMLKFYEELGKIGLDNSGAVAPEITVNEDLFKDLGIQAACALEIRYDFGNSFFAHPSVKGNQQIKDAVMNVLANGSDADKFAGDKITDYIGAIQGTLDSYYKDTYENLKENGTIDQMVENLDTFDGVLDSLENGLLEYEIPSGIAGDRAENIKDLLLDEIDNMKVTSEAIRVILGAETLDFDSEELAKLASLNKNLADHVVTIGKLSGEIGYVADFKVDELEQTVEFYSDVIDNMVDSSYDYLVNEVNGFATQYEELVELVGSYADKLDSAVGSAVRIYLTNAPKDAIKIISIYGEEAVLKLILDATAVIDDFGTSLGALMLVWAECGAEIYDDIAANAEYQELVVAIEQKVADLTKLYEETKKNPVLTALDIDKIIKKEVEDLCSLYAQLTDVVINIVEEYDEDVAELLVMALNDVLYELDVFLEAGDNYISWLGGHAEAMFGAVLQSLLKNAFEFGEATDKVIWKYIGKLNVAATNLHSEMIDLVKEFLRAELDYVGDFNDGLKSAVALKLLTLVAEFSEKLSDALYDEYTVNENSYIVSITGNDSEYAEMLALALGLADKHSIMGWDNIDESILNKADFVTIAYDRTQISGFAIEQLLASVALYGNESFREQIAAYLREALADDMSEAMVESYINSIDETIISVLEGPEFAGKTVESLDWANLVGADNVEAIEVILAELEAHLAENGIEGDYVVSVNMAALMDKYLPSGGASIDLFDSKPMFELTVPVKDIVMHAIESYIYANIMFNIEYANVILNLVANNPNVKIAVLGQYNPFNDIIIEGITIPMSEIYAKAAEISNINSLVYALSLSNVTYIDISEAKTNWNAIDDPMEFLQAYASNPYGELFTDDSNLYIMNQIFDAYGLECKHSFDNCTDLRCNICGGIRNQTAHVYEAVVTQPDCVNGGFTTHTCSICGHSYVDGETDALGHQYTNACDANCNVCEAERIPADHEYTEWKVIVEPTADAAGSQERYCCVCGRVETQIIPPTGSISPTVAEIIAVICGAAIITFGVGASVVSIIRRRKK